MSTNNIENLLKQDVIFVKYQERVFIINRMKNIPPVVVVSIIAAVAILLIQFFFEL